MTDLRLTNATARSLDLDKTGTHKPTDQKVGGSSPSERAEFPQVTALLMHAVAVDNPPVRRH